MKRTRTFGALVTISVLIAAIFYVNSEAVRRVSANYAQTSPAASPAALLLEENFDFAAGTLLTASGWTAHSGAGTNPLTVSAPSLTYSGYPSSGIGNSVAMTTTGEDANRTFAAQSSGSVYAGVLANVSEAAIDANDIGGYFFHLGPDPIGTTFRGRIYVKKNAENMLSFGITKASTSNAADIAYTPFSFSLNTTYLFVIKYTVVDGATNDTVSLFINPTLPGGEPAATISAPDVGATDINPGAVALRQGSTATAPTVRVDGIRVGQSWEDVTAGGGGPTPTATATATPTAQASSTPSATPTATNTATPAGTPMPVVFEENFNYAVGSLLTNNGWTAHSGAGTNPLTVVAPGLSYPGYSASGVGNAVGMLPTGEDAHHTFTTVSAGNVYAAVMANISEAAIDAADIGGYFFHLGNETIGTTFRGRIYVKKNAENMLSFGITKASTSNVADISYTPFAYSLNTTHLLVIKYTIIDGATNDTVSLIVNPALPGGEPAATVTAPDVIGTDINPGSVALRQGAAATGPTLTADGIRIATTWDEIGGGGGGTPTPTATATATSTASPTPTPCTSVSTFANPAAIQIPVSGPASAYPSNITVSGLGNLPATGAAVKVDINSLSHTFPDDIGMVLVGPTGAALMLQDGAGGDPDISNVSYSISDLGSAQIPNATAWAAGTFKPANYYNDMFPEPGPGQAYSNPGPNPTGSATFASTFGNTNPNGTWKLYIVDFSNNGHSGSLAGGWSITFTAAGECSPTPTPTATATATATPTSTPGGSTEFDYDGDGLSDISVHRPSTGAWYLHQSSAGDFGTLFGVEGDKIVPEDYDGDGKTDIAVYRPSEGVWFVSNSSNGTFTNFVFGLAEDLPAPGDYDGDGKADFGVFRPSDGVWYIAQSTGGFLISQFGASGDIPTPGDFDGDGKNDLAIYRPDGHFPGAPGGSAFYHQRSSDGAFFGELFGIVGDKIAPADYDGDGKTDIAIYRPADGLWTIRRSSDATYDYVVFGVATDIPAVGDFDGDGKADVTVFRPSDGTWYIRRSTDAGFTIFPWGAAGDDPTQHAYNN